MAKLRIQIHNKNNHTVSKIINNQNVDTIVFINKSPDIVKITTDVSGGVFCEPPTGTVKILEPISIDRKDSPANKDKREVAICAAFTGTEFKYTAVSGTALPEDPIIIIERSSHTSINLSIGQVIGGGVVIFLLGFAASRLFARYRGTSPT